MTRFVYTRSKKLGKPPGTLIFVGDQKIEKQEIYMLEYNETDLTETKYKTAEFDAIKNREILETDDLTNWIDIVGLHELNAVEKVGSVFDLHPLTLEDILNTDQRPKLEEYQNYIFIVAKSISYNKEISEINVEQISLVLGKGYLVTFEEQSTKIYDDLRERIRTKKGKIVTFGADYLAYSIIDVLVDNYFTVLEKMGEEIEDLEEELVVNPKADTIQNIHQYKREMIALRKSVWPLREVIMKLMRGEENEFVDEKTIVYLRDVYDHVIQVIDTIETYRDLLSGMLDIYLSSMSNRMNEIMKLLTLIGTIFIPLTFITGLYGMNFDRSSPLNMPELSWSFGYIYVWVVMLSVVALMLVYFKKKKWI